MTGLKLIEETYILATFSLYTDRLTLLSPLLKKLPQSVLAFALPVPLRVGGVFLTDLPAIMALYVSLAAESASAGGGGGGMRGG